MGTATVIYRAPEGDARVAEMQGLTFFDGIETKVDDSAFEALLWKLSNNQHFEVKLDGRRKPKAPGIQTVAAPLSEDDPALDE